MNHWREMAWSDELMLVAVRGEICARSDVTEALSLLADESRSDRLVAMQADDGDDCGNKEEKLRSNCVSIIGANISPHKLFRGWK